MRLNYIDPVMYRWVPSNQYQGTDPVRPPRKENVGSIFFAEDIIDSAVGFEAVLIIG